jgi:hypothetical protein
MARRGTPEMVTAYYNARDSDDDDGDDAGDGELWNKGIRSGRQLDVQRLPGRAAWCGPVGRVRRVRRSNCGGLHAQPGHAPHLLR